MRPLNNNSIARRDHERRPSTTTGKFEGWLHVRRCPLHGFPRASRHRPLPLQPLPATIRQRLFNGHFRAQQCDNYHRRNRQCSTISGRAGSGCCVAIAHAAVRLSQLSPKQRPASSLSRPAPSTPTSGSALTWKCSSGDAGRGSVQSRAPRSSAAIQPFKKRLH